MSTKTADAVEHLSELVEQTANDTGTSADEIMERVHDYLHRHEIDASLARGMADIKAGRVSDSDSTWARVFASLEND